MARIKASKAGSTCSDAQLTEAIRKKAQELFERSGRKPGQDLKNWLEAEKIVKSKGCCR